MSDEKKIAAIEWIRLGFLAAMAIAYVVFLYRCDRRDRQLAKFALGGGPGNGTVILVGGDAPAPGAHTRAAN